MVHIFNYKENYYIYDTGSSSLHSCDEATALYLKNKEEAIKKYSKEEIADIEEDINELKEKGLLFKEEVKIAPPKSDFAKALCLHICHDCNLRCKYCFADEGAYHARRESMSFEVAKQAVDFLIKNSGARKVLEIDFFGGEPLMNFSVVKQTVEYAKTEAEKVGKKFLFTLTTNGLLLKDDIVDFLNAEFENVVLSLDGRKEVNDAVRQTVSGKGSYDIIINNLKKFVKVRGDKSYYIRGTFTQKNLDFAEDVLFIADSGFESISMEPVVTDVPELHIGKEHISTICDEYERLADEYLKRYAEGKGFNFFHFNVDLEGGPCLSKRVSACGAGNEYFSVVPCGDIYPCHQFADKPEFKMGNVFTGIERKDIREKFKNSCLFTREKCNDCFAKFICSGGCSANNYNINGDINVPYDITCDMMKKRIECGMHIYAVKKELNENK